MDRRQSRTLFYDPVKKEITAPLPDKAAENIHGCIGSIIDKEGKLWVGCLEGVISSICIPVPLKENSSTGT